MEAYQDTQQERRQPVAGSVLPDLQKLREWHGEGVRWRSSWLTEAERLEGAVHAYQWTREEEEELERQGRKAVRSPHMAKVINAMTGWRSQNRYEIKYLPRGGSDQQIAEARTQLAKYVWDQNRGEYVFGDACLQQYIGPMGWMFVGLRFDDPSQEPITLENIPWREMVWDWRAKKLDLSDAKYVCRERWVSLEEAQALYPEKADELEQYVSTREHGKTNEWGMAYSQERAGDAVGPVSSWGPEQYVYSARKEVRIVELWYRIKRRGFYLELPDGRNIVFENGNQQHQMALMMGGIVRPGIVNDVYVATFTGDCVLEHQKSPYEHGMFPYVPVWGLIDQKGIPYGITRLIEDEQIVANWMTSKLLWVAASRQAFVGPSADLDEIAENLAKPDGLVQRKSPDEIEIIPQGDVASLAQTLLTNAITNMQEIAGSTEEVRGQESNAKSGRAILARQNAALRQQGRFLDNEQRALVQIGQILASLMDQVYTQEKILRVTEANGRMQQQAVNVTDPLRREQLEMNGFKVAGPITQGAYDVVVSTSPLSTTQREVMAESMTNLMSQLDPQVRLALLDQWVDVLDPPNKDEIIARIQQVQGMMMGPPQPDPAQQQAMQAQQDFEMQKQGLELQGKQLDVTRKAMDVEAKQAAMMAPQPPSEVIQ